MEHEEDGVIQREYHTQRSPQRKLVRMIARPKTTIPTSRVPRIRSSMRLSGASLNCGGVVKACKTDPLATSPCSPLPAISRIKSVTRVRGMHAYVTEDLAGRAPA